MRARSVPEGAEGAEAEGLHRKATRIQQLNNRKILDAAMEVFAEFGFHGATIDRVAEKAGISKPNLLYYFKSKQELYAAVLGWTLDVWIAPLSKLDPEGEPAIELRAYIAEKLEMSRLYPTASRVFANEILSGAPVLRPYLESELRDVVRQKAKTIQTWIDKGKLVPLDPVNLLFMIWATTQHYADFRPQVAAVLNKRELSKPHFARIARSISDLILFGALPRSAAHGPSRPKSPAVNAAGKSAGRLKR